MKITDIKKVANMTHEKLVELLDKQKYEVSGYQNSHDYVYNFYMNDYEISEATSNISELGQEDLDDLETWATDTEKVALVGTIKDIANTRLHDLENWQLEILEAIELK